jgi:hypothetical protein
VLEDSPLTKYEGTAMNIKEEEKSPVKKELKDPKKMDISVTLVLKE